MAVIFNLSSQTVEQSKALSKEVTEIVIETVEKIAPKKAAQMEVRSLNRLIRKKAHFYAYLILGFLIMGAVRRSGTYGFRAIIITLLICSLYAVSDEFHQLFVPGRGAQIRDVFIDIAGAIVGASGCLGIGKLRSL